MVQLKSLLEGEVCTGENLAQGELQHPQGILLVIVKHLGRGQSQNNSVTKPHRHQHHAGPLVNMYCAFIGLWSHSENWAWDQARSLPSVRGRGSQGRGNYDLYEASLLHGLEETLDKSLLEPLFAHM